MSSTRLKAAQLVMAGIATVAATNAVGASISGPAETNSCSTAASSGSSNSMISLALTQSSSNSCTPNSNPGVIFGSIAPIDSSENIVGNITFLDNSSISTLSSNTSNRFKFAGLETGKAASSGENRWSVWASSGRVNTAYKFSPRETSGNIDLNLAGIDYRPTADLTVGVAVAFDQSDISLKYASGSMDARGYTMSPYAAYRINRNITLDATMGYGRTDIDSKINAGTVSGETRAHRQTASVGLSYRHAVGSWMLTGRSTLMSTRTRLDSYTLSDSTAIEAETLSQLQLRVGVLAAYNGGWFIPTFAVTQIHDIKRTEQADVNGVSAANDKNSTQYVVGVRFKSEGQLFGGVQYSHEANRQDVKNNSVFFNIGMRF